LKTGLRPRHDAARYFPRHLAIAGLVFFLRLSATASAEIIPVDVTVGISTAADELDIKVPIVDSTGKQQFTLVCRGGSEAHVETIRQRTGVWYVPPLSCLLNEGVRETERSLLGEDDLAFWYSRGQFYWDELVGACGDYPEFGRIRHFRLRGMLITLEAQDPEIREESLAYFKLRISVKNQPSAHSLLAERSGYLHPDKDCTNVRRGFEPHMCRNSAGSWEECPNEKQTPH